MTRKVKIGLVGTGEIGQVHAKAHCQAKAAELCIAALIQPEVERRLSEQSRLALEIALASRQSCQTGSPVAIRQ